MVLLFALIGAILIALGLAIPNRWAHVAAVAAFTVATVLHVVGMS